MTDTEIERIKDAGAANMLLQHANSHICLAREKLGTAIQDKGVQFISKIQEAESHISDAKQCMAAYRTLQ